MFRSAAIKSLFGVLADPETPPEDIYQAVHECLPLARRYARGQPQEIPGIARELEMFPDDPQILLARAELAVVIAWRARGSGYGGEVTQQGWQLFKQHLDTAKKLLVKAEKLDPLDARIPTAMLDVAVGLGFTFSEMDRWFQQAMRLDTNNYEACRTKLQFLQPRWHGSPEALLHFGHECLSNGWGGNVPLILVHAHREVANSVPKTLREQYWQDERVWHDIEGSFEKFFSLNPEAIGWRHDYALYAYHARQWERFNEQTRLFAGTNYVFFGGKQRFEHMVAEAAAQARSR